MMDYIIVTVFFLLWAVIFFFFCGFIYYLTEFLALVFPPKAPETRVFHDFGDGERELIGGRWVRREK